jgi:hypothetical protein
VFVSRKIPYELQLLLQLMGECESEGGEEAGRLMNAMSNGRTTGLRHGQALPWQAVISLILDRDRSLSPLNSARSLLNHWTRLRGSQSTKPQRLWQLAFLNYALIRSVLACLGFRHSSVISMPT